jgi:phosphoribosylformimino-5-aminoimidazole carboxamide ribotide isomerase
MFQVVPSIDLREGKVVRLQQGDYQRQLNYDLDPVRVAQSFQADGAQWMHIVDLDGAKAGRPVQTDLIARIVAETNLKVQVGGGIRDRLHVDELLARRVRRVVIGTRALEDWDWFEKLVASATLDSKLVLALDAKDGIVATRGWTQSSGQRAVDVARRVQGWPLAGILYTDVAKDGMLAGPNLEHTRAIAQATDVPVLASGGVGNLDHVRSLLTLPIWGVIVGRSLHEGKLNLKQAVALARGSG